MTLFYWLIKLKYCIIVLLCVKYYREGGVEFGVLLPQPLLCTYCIQWAFLPYLLDTCLLATYMLMTSKTLCIVLQLSSSLLWNQLARSHMISTYGYWPADLILDSSIRLNRSGLDPSSRCLS